MAEFSPSTEMSKIGALAEEFYANILYDEEPLFVSDEATLWGVWMGDVDEVLERCSAYYGVPVSVEESQRPLWKLLRLLNEKRAAAQSQV
jgi:Zn-dependent peptidase ImmA (M78 family)